MAPRVSRRRRRAHPVRRAPGALIVLALSLAVCGLVAGRMHRLRADIERAATAPDSAPATTQASGATRAVYPYSIIPGGAHSAAELSDAIERDPVVRDHYEGFDLDRTRVVRLERARVAHVSYRRGPYVFWTARKVTIPAGELVLTDGIRWARTRCGNQIADLPGLTSVLEPSARELDTPSPGLRLPDVPRLGLRTIADTAPGPRTSPTPNEPGGPRPSGSTPHPAPTGGPPSSTPTGIVDPGRPPLPPGHSGDPSNNPGEATPGGGPHPQGEDTGDPPRPGGPSTPLSPPSAPPVPPTASGGPPPFSLPPVNVPRVVLPPANPDSHEPDPTTPGGTVPEPGSAALLLASAVAAAARRWRRPPAPEIGLARPDARSASGDR